MDMIPADMSRSTSMFEDRQVFEEIKQKKAEI